MTSHVTPHGPGSASGAPGLPEGFTDTFTSRYIPTGGLRQHAVIGGDGPPLLLVHGWPENWYAWRLVMPALARDFEVIAVDQRGIGLTDKPHDGYDAGTLADDLVTLMDALGHERFAVAGHDTGYIISYALAADHPDRVDRVALAEIPGPPLPPPASPPMFVPEPVNNRLWHIPFNRVSHELTEQLSRGHEDAFFGYEFAVQGGGRTLPDDVLQYYFRLFSDPDVLPSGLRGRAPTDPRTRRCPRPSPRQWRQPGRAGLAYGMASPRWNAAHAAHRPGPRGRRDRGHCRAGDRRHRRRG